MAEIADITKVQDESLEAIAIEKGLDLEQHKTKEELAAALAPLVTPEEIAALPQIESNDEGDTPPADPPENDDADDADDADTQDTADDADSADEFPKTVHVRLSKGYPLQQPHGRAGVRLTPGPEPVAVEVTEEQLESLSADRYIEIVSDDEVAAWNEHHAAVNGTPDVEPVAELAPQTTHDDINNTGAGVPSGRRYDNGINGGGDPESDNPDGSIQSERKTRQPSAPTETRELKKHADVVKRAQELGISPVVAVKGDLLRAAIKTAEADGVETANDELAKAIEKAKADKK